MRLFAILILINLEVGPPVSEAIAQEMDPEFYGYELPDYVHPDSVSASEALTLVQSGSVPAYNQWDLLRRVGRSGDATFIDPLKQLAEVFTEHDSTSRSGFNALYALRMLGVLKSYFLEKAFEHDQNLWLSKYSINVLAQIPDEATFDLLQTIRQETPDGFIHSALNSYQTALYLANKFAELEDPLERAQFLIRKSKIASGLSPWGFEAGDPESGLDPVAVWARLQLRDLYQEHPAIVDQEIASIQASPGSSFPHLAELKRQLLTHVVTADASEFPQPFKDEEE